MRALLVAYVALIALALASFGASYLHLGRLSLPVALAFAAAKAGIVLAVFMELAREKGAVRWVAAAALALVVVFVGLVSADPATRTGAGERGEAAP